MTIPLSRNTIAELAGEVIDVLSEINAIENRLTGVLRRLLALDPGTHEAPVGPMSLPGNLIISESVTGAATKLQPLGLRPTQSTEVKPGDVVGTLVGKTPGSTLTVVQGNADLIENEDGTVDVVFPGTGVRRGKGAPDPSEIGPGECVVSFTQPDERARPKNTNRGDGKHFKGRSRQEIKTTSRDMQDRILELWAETTLCKSDIARTVGVNESTVRKAIAKAKKRGDPRGIEPWQRPYEVPTTTLAQQDDSTLRKDVPDPQVVGPAPEATRDAGHEEGQSGTGSTDEPQADNEVGSGEAVSVAAAGEGDSHNPAPAASDGYDELVQIIAETMAEPAAEPEVALPPTDDVVETIAEAIVALPNNKPAVDLKAFKGETFHVLRFDEKGGRVLGPEGDVLALPGSILRLFRHMVDGRIYDLRTLADKGGYQDLSKCYEALRVYGAKLQDIGVEVVFVSKQLFRLRKVGE